VVDFLASANRRFEDIVNWFKNNQKFVDWLKTGSRYEDDPKAFSRQLHNVSSTFATGKIAILRELGVVTSSRAKYEILHDLGV
jgi:hypothetical protein